MDLQPPSLNPDQGRMTESGIEDSKESTDVESSLNIILDYAHERWMTGHPDEAVRGYSHARTMAAKDPGMSLMEEKAREKLAMIYSGELHIDTDSGERHTIKSLGYQEQFLEWVDFPSLQAVGNYFFEGGNREDAITCYTHCLRNFSVGADIVNADALYVSAYLWLLSSLYRELGNHRAALYLLEQARLGSELDICRCREQPRIDPVVVPVHYIRGIQTTSRLRIQCAKHHLLSMILLEQGCLEFQNSSKEEAKETLEKSLQLAKECGDVELVTSIQSEHTMVILGLSNDINTVMGGSFSASMADHKQAEQAYLQMVTEDSLRRLPKLDPSSNFYWAYAFDSERSKNMLEFMKASGSNSDDAVKLKLGRDRKQLAELQTMGIQDGELERYRMKLLTCVHFDLFLSLRHRTFESSWQQDLKHHFKEAVNCAKVAFAGAEDMALLNIQLYLGYYALDTRIREYDDAAVLFKGVIQIFDKKLKQLASMSDKHALKFLELTKFAYSNLIYTYYLRALKLVFEAQDQERLDLPADIQSHLFNGDDVYQSLLWSERLKARLLSKLLDTVTSTSEEEAYAFELFNDESPSWFGSFFGTVSGIMEHRFHNDNDWALNFLLSDFFVHRVSNEICYEGHRSHIGPKMFFIVYTMLAPNKMLVCVLRDGGVMWFSHLFLLENLIDEETHKLAEEEADLLRQGMRHYKKPDVHAALTSKSTEIPPSLYAMNEPESRIGHYNPWIPGLVARFQRLVCEAQRKRGSIRDEDYEEEIVHIDILLQKFYNILIKPIAEVLLRIEEWAQRSPGKSEDYMLVFVPHEDLSIVPFHALRDENGKYLIEQHPVSVCPSIWILRHCQHLHIKQLQTICGPELLVGRTSGYPEGWKDLSSAHKEIEVIEKTCDRSVTVVRESGSGVDAADRSMKERVMEKLQTASWAHFAVHGEISPSFPRGSLLLGASDMDRWNSDEITATGLPCARSVVLSACQSGLGTLGGEGVLGFARAFLRAGVPSCVLSLWQVKDGVCLEFTAQLYKRLRDGEALVHAMRNSTLHMMQERRNRFPRDRSPPLRWPLVLDWAAFSCIGYAGVKFPNQSSYPLELHNKQLTELPGLVQQLAQKVRVHQHHIYLSPRSEDAVSRVLAEMPTLVPSGTGPFLPPRPYLGQWTRQ